MSSVVLLCFRHAYFHRALLPAEAVWSERQCSDVGAISTSRASDFIAIRQGGIFISALYHIEPWVSSFNTLRPGQNGRHFADDSFGCIFLNENVWIAIKMWLIFVPKDPINNIPALVQIMAWRRTGDKPLSEPMMVSLPMHKCVTRPQRVKDISLEFR